MAIESARKKKVEKAAKLKVVSGFVQQRENILPERGRFTIGRDRRRNLPIMSRKVSREHAAIECEGGQYVLVDCESKRGTKVNRRSVTRRRLRAGDVIEIGDVTLEFTIEAVRPAFTSFRTPAQTVVSVSEPATEKDATELVIIPPKPKLKPKVEEPLSMVEVPKPQFSDEELSIVGKTIGDIRIIAALSKGRRTVIYKGIQDSKNRVVALKALNRAGRREPEVIRWFIEGARKAGDFRHEDAVVLLGGGREGNIIYAFSHFMDGGSARERFARTPEEGLVTIKRALESIVHVSRALEFAQGEGMLHLGVRPCKILFDEKRRAKLAGLGFDNSPSAPASGSLAEVSAYMAPEQLSGRGEVTYATDIYSLGATFYYMLTGRGPIRNARQRISSPKLVNDEVPDSICRIIEKMMDSIPDRRYKSYGQLLHDVRWALRGESWPRG